MGKVQSNKNQISSFLISLAFVLTFLSVLAGMTYLWMPGGLEILPSGSYGVAAAVVILISGLLASFKKRFSFSFSVEALALGAVLIFVSDWLCRGYNFFQGPAIRGEIIFFSLIAYLLYRFKKLNSSWMFIALLSIAGSLYCFFTEAQGRLLFSDDHGTFLYRLQLLKENFPFIPFFNPQWNAGLDARDSFATGVLNLFALSQPWIYFFEVESFYTVLIATLIFVVFPLSNFYAARLVGLSKNAAWIASLLVTCSGLHWYRWSLKYGTMGFVVSAMLLPLVLALSSRIISKSRQPLHLSILFVCCTTLCLCWPFFGVVLLPVFAVLGTVFCREWAQKQKQSINLYRRLLIIGISLCLINFPVMLTFLGTSGIGKFIGESESAIVSVNELETKSELSDEELAISYASERRFRKKAGSIDLRRTLSTFRSIVFSSNPILLLFGLGGVFLLPATYRLLLLMQISWFFIVGGVLYPLKPQLELDRLLVLIIIICAVPAAYAVEQLVIRSRESDKKWLTLSTMLVIGFIFTGPPVVWSIIKNRSVEQYYFADSMVDDFRSFLASYNPNGRILFSGCVLHEYGGGHLAPLAQQVGHPMVASSHAHTLWWYKDVIPSYFLREGDRGKETFMDLYNISDVFAHEKKWRRYFRRRKDLYESVWQGHGFELFRRKGYQPTYFSNGEGQILQQTTNSVVLRPDTKEVVIKFRYNPALEAPGCRVMPQPVYEQVNFVRLTDCTPGKVVELKEKVPWQQLFLKERNSIG